MPHVDRFVALKSVARTALLAVAIALFAAPQLASAQSGSAGGSLGDGEKSLSGARAPRSVESAAPARRRPAREKPRAARSGGGGGSVDGAWMVVSVGRPCGGASEAIVISSGRFVGQYTSGQVSPGGQVTGAGSANGVSWTSSGRFAARSGSGTFRRSDGCVGTWTASKQ